jgi:3-oxoacyl-[acyl-carrier protein] reductase
MPKNSNGARSDKVAIMTGAARGLGLAMTLSLAEAGWRVGAVDIDGGRADSVAAAKERGVHDRLLWLKGDVRDQASCLKIVADVVEAFGAVHALVNNAGLGMQGIGNVLVGPKTKFFEVDFKTWRNVFAVNVDGPFLMAQATLPHLLAQGWGRIVNVVTSKSTMMAEGFSPYGPTKAAVEASTVIWSKDLAGSGVTVNALLPGGAANTRMIPNEENIDRSTLVQPEIMGPPIVWLLSDEANNMTGQRVIASEWVQRQRSAEAAEKACAPAGW